MNKLRKAAWFNLGGMIVCMIFLAYCFIHLNSKNATGIIYVVITVFVPCIIAPVLYYLFRKFSIESRFDEREKIINRKAFIFSAYGLVTFLGLICLIPYFILGAQNFIKVYYLPLILCSTLFFAQFVHSMAILILCAMEEDDEQ